MNNAVLYIRVSTDEQAKYGYSIDMQQNQCFNFAQKEGFNIIGVYIDDGYTARNPNRPQYKKLFEDIKNKKNGINAVIVWRCDRMVRNTGLYHAQIVPKFAQHGVALLSATENNDMNNPYGRYIRNNQINNAELESELTSIRTIENLKEKARQGYFPGSIPPVGYIRDKIDGKKIIKPDPTKADYIKEVFKLYTNGFSFKEIARLLAKKGFTHNNKPCSKKLVENILTVYDIFYIGKFRYKGDIYNGKHEAILSLEEYGAFKTVRNQKYKPKQIKHDFIYKGLITCPKTGRIFVGEHQKGGNKSGIYTYYRCHHTCEYCQNCKRIIKSDIIDKAVIESIKTIDISEEKILELKEDLKGILLCNNELNEKRKLEINSQLTKLNNRLLALYDDKIDGLISDDIYIKKRDTWQNQIEDLTIELAAISKTQTEIFKRIENMLELCKDLTGAYLRHTDEKKHILLKMLCSNFFYDGSKLTITIKEPFKALMNFAIFKNGAHGGSLLELFNKILHPVFNSSATLILLKDIENFIESNNNAA